MSYPVINLKTVMKLNSLLAANKASGPPTHFHPPWRKTRIFPMMERAQSVELAKPTRGSDSSESGMVIDGVFFQSKEGKSIREKLSSKQLCTPDKCQSSTSKNTDSSTDGKSSFSQKSYNLEREPYGYVSNRQQSHSKVKSANEGTFLNPYLDRYSVTSISSPHPYGQNVAYMTSFDSDKDQDISDESNSESSSEIEQDDPGGKSKTQTEQDSETETDTESDMESGTESDSYKESENENVSESKKKAEAEDLPKSRCNISGTQEFVKSVMQTMNETQSSKPRFTSSIAEISSTIGFNLTRSTWDETMHEGKAKKQENKMSVKKEDDSETRINDPKPLLGQQKDISKSSSSSGSGYIQSTTDKGNLPPIAEDEGEEMTSAGSLRSRLQGSASGAKRTRQEKDKEDTDTNDTVTTD